MRALHWLPGNALPSTYVHTTISLLPLHEVLAAWRRTQKKLEITRKDLSEEWRWEDPTEATKAEEEEKLKRLCCDWQRPTRAQDPHSFLNRKNLDFFILERKFFAKRFQTLTNGCKHKTLTARPLEERQLPWKMQDSAITGLWINASFMESFSWYSVALTVKFCDTNVHSLACKCRIL